MAYVPIVLSVLVVLALLAYGLADALRYAFRKAAPLPLVGMLRRDGLSPGEAQEALGRDALADATRRCALCTSGSWCAELVKAGMAAPVDCPNAALLAELGRPRA